jgi:hypothetical protein
MTTFLLQQDNVRPHTSLKTMEHFAEFGLAALPHPPYIRDLALSDFHLFRPVKDRLCGQHFPDNAVIATVRRWVASAGAGSST